jgi:hypothetical protein
MAKNQRTHEQRWHEIDFSNRLTDTSLWIKMADELVDAANILEAEVIKYWSEIQLDEHNHPVSTSGRKYVQGEYSLLIAYALENYFKALLIHQNQKDLKGWLLTKLPGYLKHHDLGKLAAESKFKLDTSEEELLFRLSRSSIWAARYPIPIEPEALANMKKFSNGRFGLIAYYAPQDINRIHNLIDRLRNHVLAEIKNNA